VGYLARTWRLLGRNGGVWAVLATGDIGSIPLLAPNAGERTGLAASIRGWPCDAFLMEVANGAALAPAEWQMYCWGREAAPSAVAGSGALPSVVVPAPELRTDSGAPAGAAVASLVVHAGPCQFSGFSVRNVSAGPRYVMVFDAAALPANGAVPILEPLLLGAGQSGVWEDDEFACSAGIVIASSTTDGILTIGGADLRITGFHRHP